jgi:5-methylcytosine-specific restriction endonuclease McrA
MGNTRGRFQKSGGAVSATEDVDHIQDLQLGGSDEVWNMRGLDRSVNRSMGSQIQQKIKNLPEGTKIGKVTISD